MIRVGVGEIQAIEVDRGETKITGAKDIGVVVVTDEEDFLFGDFREGVLDGVKDCLEEVRVWFSDMVIGTEEGFFEVGI